RRDGIDPSPLLYSRRSGRRVVAVVNVLGGQMLKSGLPPSFIGEGWAAPRLVDRYPSAAPFVVTRHGHKKGSLPRGSSRHGRSCSAITPSAQRGRQAWLSPSKSSRRR